MFAEFRTAKEIFDAAQREGRLIRNPDNERLRAMAMEEPGVIQSKYDNLVVESEPKSRAAMMTKNNIDDALRRRRAASCSQQAKQRLAKRRVDQHRGRGGRRQRGDHRPADRAAEVFPPRLRRRPSCSSRR